MPRLQHSLAQLSRDRKFLIRASAAILAAFFLIGLLTDRAVGSQFWLLLITVSLAGLVWFVVIAKLGGVDRVLQTRTLFALMGIVLGIFSAITTVHVAKWQSSLFDLNLNGELLNDLIFCVSDIGLREEMVKMIFVMPMIPLVLRRRNEAEMLLVSSCVGLGFAIEENINYLHADIGATVGRLFTANFAHIAWTGALGLALFRLVRWPKSRWEEFLGTFVAVVLLHGIYDAFFFIPVLAEYGVLGFILFCVIAHRHFDLIADTREHVTHKISPLGVFILGCAVLVGLTWIIACARFGWHEGIQVAGSGALGFATLAFLYINRLREE